MPDQKTSPVPPTSPTENGAGPKTPVSMKAPAIAARRPTRQCPTVRIAAAKQLDLLRAFDAAAGPNAAPVTLATVSKLIGMTVSTISLANPFFVAVGLLRKIEATKFTPTAEVHEYAVAYECGAGV